jgi:hypothetical protein
MSALFSDGTAMDNTLLPAGMLIRRQGCTVAEDNVWRKLHNEEFSNLYS